MVFFHCMSSLYSLIHFIFKKKKLLDVAFSFAVVIIAIIMYNNVWEGKAFIEVSFSGEFTSPLHVLPFWLQFVEVTPHLITSNAVVQETVTFSFILVEYKVLTNLCSYCSWVSTCGMQLVQTLWYFNIASIVSIALKPILSSLHSSVSVIQWFV